jgi:hypothetical protein
MKVQIAALIIAVFIFSCKSGKNKTFEPADNKKTDTASVIKTDNPVNPYAPVDISPMDMSYFPEDYPKLKMAKQVTQLPLARVIYSRPHLQGRHIFHEVLKYGEPWRMGANEATELDLYSDATIQGKKITAGRYILYCIPQESTWTIILNSNIDSWGLEPDAAKDIYRFNVPVKTNSFSLEFFTMVFEKSATGADLLMAWDNVEARLPISF